ncbi:hypothetical protein ACE193_23535 [Bernardetia sp. OM2101]|uniref:hypothetical protein n=1 Tax=Bernardetia sp. OM2101 TaxID=3344876 RepID=UPI0035CEE793
MKNIFFIVCCFACLITNSINAQSFRTKWITTDTKITIPTNDSLEYNYDIK